MVVSETRERRATSTSCTASVPPEHSIRATTARIRSGPAPSVSCFFGIIELSSAVELSVVNRSAPVTMSEKDDQHGNGTRLTRAECHIASASTSLSRPYDNQRKHKLRSCGEL